MQLNEGGLTARWLRLGRYDRDAWRIAHEASDENVWEVYSARLRRVEAVRLKILGRYTRLKRPEQPGILNKTVTWCPGAQDLETYDAATIVLTGKVSHYIKLRADELRAIDGWEPITDSTSDCEGGQGFIYCPESRASEIVERLQSIGIRARVSDSVNSEPPRTWGIRSAWPTVVAGERPVVIRSLGQPGPKSPTLQVSAELHRRIGGALDALVEHVNQEWWNHNGGKSAHADIEKRREEAQQLVAEWQNLQARDE